MVCLGSRTFIDEKFTVEKRLSAHARMKISLARARLTFETQFEFFFRTLLPFSNGERTNGCCLHVFFDKLKIVIFKMILSMKSSTNAID